jgi:hypothetical protein
MFLILFKNYIKAFFKSIIFSRKIKRLKNAFEVSGYNVYLDAICLIDKKAKINIVDFYSVTLRNLLMYNHQLKVLYELKNKGVSGYNTMFKFIETVVLSDRRYHTYINKIEIKSISDIRNDKLNKLLISK